MFLNALDDKVSRTPHLKLKWIGFVEKEPNLEYLPSEVNKVWVDFEVMLKETKKTLLKPLELKQWSHQVYELTSQEDLDLEGRTMGHCVAGYGSALKRGESRIFHLTTLQGISTLELNSQFEVRQHKSLRNHEPHKANKKMARRFIKFLKSSEKINISEKSKKMA